MRDHRTGLEAQPTFLSLIHERFVNGVYEDLQDFIFNRFNSPSVVYIREDQNTVRPCFPRGEKLRDRDGEKNRYRGFCDFCKMVRRTFGRLSELSPCVQNEISYIEDGIQAEDRGASWKWQWQPCHMGLLDYYAPIRSIEEKDGIHPILAVLVFGHFRDTRDATAAMIEAKIFEVVFGVNADKCLAGLNKEQRQEKAAALRGLIQTIPLLTDEKRNELTEKLEEIVSLVTIIATHTLRAGTLHDGDRFVKELRFELGDVRITEDLFHVALRNGLREIREYLDLETAAMYKSSTLNYAFLMPQAIDPANATTSSPLTVDSLAGFRKFVKYEGVCLPDGNHDFDWLAPEKVVGTKNGIFFAHETVSGDLIVLAFGYGEKTPKAFQRAVLAEAVNEKLLPFIDNAISTLALDLLMFEVGHLLGRTRAKIQAGYDYLERVAEEIDVRKIVKDTPSEDWLLKGEAAIMEGIVKLHLIRHNFYAFRQVRSEDEEELPAKPIDIVALLREQVAFFRQSMRTTPLTRLDYQQSCEKAVVKAVRERLELVFLNLFDNMCKFAYSDTFGTISIAKDGDACVIEFTNLGFGVAPDETELVFQPQVKTRYNDPAKRKEGIGMGLTLCRRVVEKECGGEIALRSVPVNKPNRRRGEGDNFLTTVTVRLPMINQQKEDQDD